MAMDEQEEFEFRMRMEAEQAAQAAPAAPAPPTQEEIDSFRKPKSGYAGIPEDQMKWWQKADRALALPGHEMFSPGANAARKDLAISTANNIPIIGSYLPQAYGRVKGGALGSPEYLKSRDEMVARLSSIDPGIKATGMALATLPTFGAGPLLKAATVPGRIALATGLGALQFGLTNPGDTPGEYAPAQLLERGKNAVKGGLLGGTLATVANVPQMAKGLKQSANYRAVKAGGGMLKDYRNLDRKDILDRTGDMLMTPQEGPEGKLIQVVTPGATTEEIADRTGQIMKEHGERLKKVYSTLDDNFDKIANSPARDALVTPSKIADSIEQQLIRPMEGVQARKELLAPLRDIVNDFRAMPNQPMRFGEVKRQLSGYDDMINYDKLGGAGKELQKQVRGIINGHMEKAVDAVGQASNFPLYENWKKSKEIFGSMKQMNDIANDKVFRETANRFISPSDHGVGIGMGVASAAAKGAFGPQQALMAAGGAVGNNLMRRFGNNTAALTANNASRLLSTPNMQQFGQFAARQVQPAVTASAQASSPPDPARFRSDVTSKLQGTPYAEQLAGAQSDQDFALRYFALSQGDPNFRAALEGKHRTQ